MGNRPVCIYQAADAGEAQLVKDLLQDEGIEALVVGDDQPFPGLTAVESVDVLVAATDEARATMKMSFGPTRIQRPALLLKA